MRKVLTSCAMKNMVLYLLCGWLCSFLACAIMHT